MAVAFKKQSTKTLKIPKGIHSGTKFSPPSKFKQELIRFFRSGRPASPESKVRVIVDAYRQATPPARRSAVAEALLRGIEAQNQFKDAEGGSLSADEVRSLIHLKSKQGVLDRHDKGLLLGWREKQNAVRFPVWQFAPRGVLPGFAETLQVLNENRHLDDWAKVLFFLSPRESLDGRRPLDLLRADQTDRVLSMARAYGE